MVLVIPICAALTLAQVIYLNMNHVDPLTVGSSSVTAVAAIGVGASAIIAHVVHALLGQARRPFNTDTHRTLGNSSNALNHYIHPQLSCYDPDTPNNTTQLHNVTTRATDLRWPTYVHPSTTIPNNSGWRMHAKPTLGLDTRPRGPGRLPRPRNMGNSSCYPPQQPIQNVYVSLEQLSAEVSLPATRTAFELETRVLEHGNALDWRIGCLFGLIVGLVCGIPIGSTVAQRRCSTVEHEPRPLSSTPLPPYWIINTTDESAALAAVKQYSSVLSAIVDSVSNYPVEYEALAMESKPVSETSDSTIDDLITETVTVTTTATSEDFLVVTDIGLTTADTIDPASVPLPEDESEDIFGDAETFGAVEPIVDPTLVPLPEDDLSASDEDQADLFNRVDLESNMSLCTVVGGMGFDLALEDLAGDVADHFQPANSTISALKVAVAGIKEPSKAIGTANVEMRPAKRRRLLGPEEERGLVKDADSELSCATIGSPRAGESTCHPQSGADMVEDSQRQPSGDSWESRGSHFDFSDSDSEGADEDPKAGPDTACRLPTPPSLPDARTLQFLAPSMRARYSRLEVIEELVEEEGSLPGSTHPRAVLGDSYAGLDHSLLSADMSLDSDPGLTTVHPTLELAESESTGGEWLFGLAPRLLAPSKSCPGSLAHHIADAGFEHVVKRAVPPMVPSFSSPSLLAYSVELPRRVLGVSMRARSSSYPGSLSSLTAGGPSTGHPTWTERVVQEQQTVDEPANREAKKRRRRSRASQAGQVRRAAAYEVTGRRAGRRANK